MYSNLVQKHQLQSIDNLNVGDRESQLFVCGKNQNYELGFKDVNYIDTPLGMKGIKDYEIKEVSSGQNHSAIVTINGQVFMFGSNLHEKLGIDYNNVSNWFWPILLPISQENFFVQIVCGEYHTLGLTDEGKIWGWGGTWHKKQASRNQKPSILQISNWLVFVQIGCGDFHSMALTEQGVLYSWGGGGKDFNKGQTGHDTNDDIETPSSIQFFKEKPILSFCCGGLHSTAIATTGEVYSWGEGQFGQLGHQVFEDEKIPRKIEAFKGHWIESLANGYRHSFFLSDQGQLFSCGKGTNGQTGLNTSSSINVPTHLWYLESLFIKEVKCGQNHTLIMAEPNIVYSTGYNKYGQLGQGNLDHKMTFCFVPESQKKNVTKIYAGGHHSWFQVDKDEPEQRRQISVPQFNFHKTERASNQYKNKTSNYKEKQDLENDSWKYIKENSLEGSEKLFESSEQEDLLQEDLNGISKEYNIFNSPVYSKPNSNEKQVALDKPSFLKQPSQKNQNQNQAQIQDQKQSQITFSGDMQQFSFFPKKETQITKQIYKPTRQSLSPQKQSPEIKIEIGQNRIIPAKKVSSERVPKRNPEMDLKLIFVDLQYSHRFLLIDYKEINSAQIEQELKGFNMQWQGVSIKSYFVANYDDFSMFNENEELISCLGAVRPTQREDTQTIIVHLIVDFPEFNNQFDIDQNESNYSMIKQQEESLGHLYSFNYNQIKKDHKWNYLFQPYEDIIENVSDMVEKITLIELRPNKYK